MENYPRSLDAVLQQLLNNDEDADKISKDPLINPSNDNINEDESVNRERRKWDRRKSECLLLYP